MRVAVLADDGMKEELIASGYDQECIIEWFRSPDEFPAAANADAVFDLLFEKNDYSISHLKKISSKLIFVNSVCKTINEIGLPVIRVNGWPGFLSRNITEASCNEDTDKKQAETILAAFGKRVEWVPDVKGFISPRVVSMIINEAYFALEEKVSTKEDIDIAMKLGTNYPYGPFEWSGKIGLKNISTLLTELSKQEKRYEPSTLLIKETTTE